MRPNELPISSPAKQPRSPWDALHAVQRSLGVGRRISEGLFADFCAAAGAYDLRMKYKFAPDEPPPPDFLADFVRLTRRIAGWKQGALAFKAGVSLSTILSAWGVFDPAVTDLFTRLASLRHRSVHFNPATSTGVRGDALASITTLRDIIEQQFGACGLQRWFIRGTKGACFIAKAYETDPFVKHFLAPRSMYVGPLHGVRIGEDLTWQFVDWPPEVYGVGEVTDEQYCHAFNERDPSAVVPTDGPFIPATILGPDDVVTIAPHAAD